MIDRLGRNIDYIRISVTDKCNLRCVYCMPEEGIEYIPHKEIISYEEILRLANAFASLGIHSIKLTGGEPLIRKGITSLVRELKSIPGIEQVTITTNGILLADKMKNLSDAGIDGINLSLDTLNPEVFQKITRRDSFEQVMIGFQEALKYPQVPLKVNCVPMGLEGQDIIGMAELAKKYPVHVRYIEMMPIGYGKKYDFCSEEDILAGLVERYGPYTPFEEKLGNGPGHYYSFEGFKGKIGFISAISHKFCNTCNRVRLTSQGYLKSCLQYDIGTDLKSLLRNGITDEGLVEVIKETIYQKPQAHQFVEHPKDHEEELTMSEIGG